MSGISILFGLGNPGTEYRHTRHNIGAETLNVMVDRHGLQWEKTAGGILESRLRLAGKEFILLRSLLFMNVSGEAIAGAGNVGPDSLLVVCDDINLPLGRLRFRERGGSGGHRGLESISSYLATDEFARLRMGVGAPPPGVDWSDYVLLPFPEEEMKQAERMIATAAEALELVMRKGIRAAMDMYNRWCDPSDSP